MWQKGKRRLINDNNKKERKRLREGERCKTEGNGTVSDLRPRVAVGFEDIAFT